MFLSKISLRSGRESCSLFFFPKVVPILVFQIAVFLSVPVALFQNVPSAVFLSVPSVVFQSVPKPIFPISVYINMPKARLNISRTTGVLGRGGGVLSLQEKAGKVYH